MKEKGKIIDQMSLQYDIDSEKIKNSNMNEKQKALRQYGLKCTFFAKIPLLPYAEAYRDYVNKKMSTAKIILNMTVLTLIPILPIVTLLALAYAALLIILSTLKLPFELAKAAHEDNANQPTNSQPLLPK